MLEILRVTEPTIAQYSEASLVAAEQWPDTKVLIRKERFQAFQQLGVELVLAQENEELLGVAFLLPDKYQSTTQEHNFVWLFRVFSRPQAKNLGALMLLKIMNWYPVIMGIGITPVAAKLYQTLRWKQYDQVWRCVHPIKLKKMVEQYTDRLGGFWKVKFFKTIGWGYELVSSLAESLINSRYAAEQKTPRFLKELETLPNDSHLERKLKIVSSYLTLYRITKGDKALEAFAIMGIGRIVRDDFQGLKRFLAHVKLWQDLRKNDASFSEYIATSERDKSQAYYCGYIPLRMPIYYWDKHKILDDYFINFATSNFNFASCDKLL